MNDARNRNRESRDALPADRGTTRLEDIAPLVGEAARAVGTERFYDALLAVYRRLVRHQLVTVVRYKRFSKPDFLFHRDYSDELANAYLDRFYELDPFHHYWRAHERPGVVALHEFPAAELKRSRYIWEFLQQSRINDELGLFLPPVARSSVAMFLERGEGLFQPTEIARARRFYPLLAGLHDAHINCTFASLGSESVGLGLHQEVPTAIIDSGGDMVFANAAWRDLEVADPEVRRARSALEESEDQELPITGGRVLHRERLDTGFCLAPGGWLYLIEAFNAGSRIETPRQVFERIHPELSPREFEVIDLILHGHTTDSIAQALHLSRGTIKNYRRRLYAKLDISSERELFLAYIEGLPPPGPQDLESGQIAGQGTSG